MLQRFWRFSGKLNKKNRNMRKTKGKGNAGKLGKWAETKVLNVIDTIKGNTIPRFTFNAFSAMKETEWPDVFVVGGVPINRMWAQWGYVSSVRKNTGGRTEFVLFIKKQDGYDRIRIEVKNQDVSGTTYDKIPMAMLDMLNGRPDEENNRQAFIVVIGKELVYRINALKGCLLEFKKRYSKEQFTMLEIVDLDTFTKELKLLLK